METLSDCIRQEIATTGPISFARFMEMALYHPSSGYYERGFTQTGKGGDFITSVSIGPIFGELLGFSFTRKLQPLQLAQPLLIEAGAHDGQLAFDLLSYLHNYQPAFFQQVHYIIVEPSPARAARQQQKLERFAPCLSWVQQLQNLPPSPSGILFSNELLDAFPVHRFRWNASTKGWIEQGVSHNGTRFVWVPLPNSHLRDFSPFFPPIPAELTNLFPEGFTVEVSPAALAWWKEAARSLSSGALLAFDYGGPAESFLQPSRSGGTLRAYSRHQLVSDLLAHPGEQDLTANVNFTPLISAAEQLGFTTIFFGLQEFYLKQLIEQIDQAPDEFPLWTPHRLRQLASLMHPEHMGRSFKVLAQEKNLQP